MLAGLTTVFVVVLTVPAAYWARVVNSRIRVFLELSAAIPFALPFLVIGMALLEFSGMVAPALQGSMALLVAAYVAVTFPVVYWAVDAAMVAAGVERLAEAAATCGASGIQTLWRVVLPNIRSGVVAGAMLSFATVVGEFALVSVLASGVRTLPVWSAGALRDRTTGGVGPLAAVTLLTFVSLFALSWLVARASRRRTSTATAAETTDCPSWVPLPSRVARERRHSGRDYEAIRKRQRARQRLAQHRGWRAADDPRTIRLG